MVLLFRILKALLVAKYPKKIPSSSCSLNVLVTPRFRSQLFYHAKLHTRDEVHDTRGSEDASKLP